MKLLLKIGLKIIKISVSNNFKPGQRFRLKNKEIFTFILSYQFHAFDTQLRRIKISIFKIWNGKWFTTGGRIIHIDFMFCADVMRLYFAVLASKWFRRRSSRIYSKKFGFMDQMYIFGNWKLELWRLRQIFHWPPGGPAGNN